jgi:RNA polymerase sigma-70 factor, ECF subfamily
MLVEVARAVEDETIQDAAAGDTAAFEVLLAPLLEPAFKLATLLLGDRDEADDAVQEAAVRAWTRINQLRGDRSRLRAWFLSIVANQCRSMRRRSWWRVIKLPDLVRSDNWAEDEAVRSLDLRSAIERLDQGDQFALFTFFYLDLPLQEAATVMGVSLGTAKSRIYRAVRRLRKDAALEGVLRV